MEEAAFHFNPESKYEWNREMAKETLYRRLQINKATKFKKPETDSISGLIKSVWKCWVILDAKHWCRLHTPRRMYLTFPKTYKGDTNFNTVKLRRLERSQSEGLSWTSPAGTGRG